LAEVEEATQGSLRHMALKYCPNGECVNFQSEVDTEATRCVMCAWNLLVVKKSSESLENPKNNSQVA
jgi:hypothetical protein